MVREFLKKTKRYRSSKRWYLFLSIIFLIAIGPRPDEALDISGQEQQEEPAYIVDENQRGIFPVPMELKENIEFWRMIYGKYSSDEVVIHDGKYMGIIYTKIDFAYLKDEDLSERESERVKNRKIKEVKGYYKNIILKLSKSDLDISSLNTEEKRIYYLYSNIKDEDKFVMDRRGKRIRAQTGQKDFFIKGLINSGEYLAEMERIFDEYGLPPELTRLTFVESMFNTGAYSKSGAAGIWQFLKSTGRRYLTINRVVDERRDPILSTVAAARYLTKNYEYLGNWPLAITAYNHGSRSIRRAVEETNSSHLPVIINNYNHRRFGFASRNFYAEFLAAIDIVRNYKFYFGDISIKPPLSFDVVQINKNMLLRDIVRFCNITSDDIIRLNPALQRDIINSRIYLPKGFTLKIPDGKKEVFYKGIESIGNVYTMKKANKKKVNKKKEEEMDRLNKLLGDSKGISF